jgi:NADH:ubiquinone oxidoreductase subunit K
MTGVILAAAFVALGLYGVLTRRELIALLASVEVMLGGATLLLVVLTSATGYPVAVGVATSGEAVALLLLAVVAAEAAVGLALLVALVARGHTRTDEIEEVRG